MSIEDLEDIEVTIWFKPHKGYGFIKTLLAWVEEGAWLAFVQEQQGKARPLQAANEIIEELDYVEKKRTDLNISPLIELISNIKFELLGHEEFKGFGGSFYGVRIENGQQKVTYEWHGTPETFDRNVVAVYQYVLDL